MRFSIERINISPGIAILPDHQGKLVVVRFDNSEILTTEQETQATAFFGPFFRY